MRENHITVCVCTFRRPGLLRRLLVALDRQVARGFTYSLVVADNDRAQSAKAEVEGFRGTVAVVYCTELEPNIAMARNQALSRADGEFAAFIDDDEVPGETWLVTMFEALKSQGGEGVLGPVRPYFDDAPPEWVTRGRFFERPSHPTGLKLSFGQCRTGNVLFAQRILKDVPVPFRPQFGSGGEDTDFFQRMTEKGYVFTWCEEAPVHELVPPARSTFSFLLKRAMLRGSNFPKHSARRGRNILKSLVAVPAYAIALPVLALLGQHLFVKYFVKLSEHGSRLLASAGWSLVKERQT
jgi:succinoglycan biosynthesis protein ExoM